MTWNTVNRLEVFWTPRLDSLLRLTHQRQKCIEEANAPETAKAWEICNCTARSLGKNTTKTKGSQIQKHEKFISKINETSACAKGIAVGAASWAIDDVDISAFWSTSHLYKSHLYKVSVVCMYIYIVYIIYFTHVIIHIKISFRHPLTDQKECKYWLTIRYQR